MAQYIDKSALVAEIKRRIKKFREQKDYDSIVKTNTYKGLLSFIDTLEVKGVQEEPVAPKVLEDMLNAKTAAESLGISQEEHDRIVDELIYGKEPELVDADDLPNEEPVSEQKLSNVGRTVKDRKEKSVSEIDFEQELYKAFGHVKDFTLCLKVAKWFYDMGKNSQEPVSKPNEQLAETYLAMFDKKFPILPTLKGKQLADYKNFLNKCQQIFGLKEWGIHPIQSKLFEKLTLLWATWGAEHLQGVGRQDEKEQDIPVSEDLEKAAVEAFKQIVDSDKNNFLEIFKAGAKWQREQMMKDVIERSRKAICKSRTFPISFNLLLARILDYVIHNKPLK